MLKGHKKIPLTYAVCALSAGLGMPTWAQPEATGIRILEEVIVSARRTEESIQSTPVSVAAYDTRALRESSISNPEDLQIATPGVFLAGAGGRQNVVYQIRGQSKTTFGPSSPAVVSYFAEVPDPFMGSFVPQYDMASIEVLKGPQGTLFGRNTTGGAILYSPQGPTHEFGGYISAGVGNYNDQQVQGALNLPLIDGKLALRLAMNIHQRDAFTDNLGNGGELDNLDDQSYRASLLFEPTESISNTSIVEYYRSDTSSSAMVLYDVATGPTLLASLGIQNSAFEALEQQRQWGPYKTRSFNSPDDEKNERSSFTNRTEIDFGTFELVNIFGYRDTSLFLNTNTDGMFTLTADGPPYGAGTPVNFIKANLTNETEQTSNELQLRGRALDDNLSWLVGAFWLQSEPSGPQGSEVAFGHVPLLPLPNAAYTFITEESRAVFSHFSYELTALAEGLQLELGVRYTEDEVEACTGSGVSGFSNEVDLSDCESGAANIVNSSVNKTSAEEVTWSVGLNWQATDDVFAYLVTRRGYRAGGVNGPTYSGRLQPLQSFQPETVTDIELGLRSDWRIGDVGVRSNVSVFRGQYDDVQSGLNGIQTASALCNPASTDNPSGISPDGDCDISNDPAGGVMIVNLGESEVSGIDLELTIAATENLTLNVAGNFLDLETKRFDVPATLAAYVADSELPFTYTAEQTFTAGLRYEQSMGTVADAWVLNVDYYWTDDVRFADFETPSYDVTNLRLDVNGIAGSALDFSLFVRNVFDDDYVSAVAAGGTFLGMKSVIYGPPRLYGAELRYRFGAE